MINRLLIKQRLALIGSYLSELEKLAAISKEAFLRDKLKTGAAESYLRRSLEAIFDIGRHILAKTGSVELAGEYKTIATGLAQKNIVDKNLSEKLVEMAGYRNRLVHMYSHVTDEELYEIIAGNLKDIREFVKQLRNYLK